MMRRSIALALALAAGVTLPAAAYKGKGRGARARVGTFLVSSSSSPIDPDAVLFLLVGVPGQSNDAATNGAPAVTTTASSLDFKACQQRSGLAQTPRTEPLRENYATGCWSSAERPGSGAVQAVRDRIPFHGPAIVAINCAVAGASITDYWDTGAGGAQTNYNVCIERIQDAWDLVQASPSTYRTTSGLVRVLGTVSAQGEADYGMSESAYRGHLDAMLAAFQTAVEGITGQTQLVHHVYEQPSTWSVSGSLETPPGPVLAQIAKCAADANVHCVGGTYAHEGESSSPFLHKEPANHRLSGEIRGGALADATIGGSSFAPPLMVNAVSDDLTLIVDFDRAVESATAVETITLGTGTGGATANYYTPVVSALFTISGPGSPPTVSGCSFAGARSTCSLSSALDAADSPVLEIAWRGTPPTGAFGLQGSTSNPGTNIRSTAAIPIYAQHGTFAIETDGGGFDAGPDSGVHADASVDAGAPAFANTAAINCDDVDDYVTVSGGLTANDNVSSFTMCWWDYEGTRGVNEYAFGEYMTAQRKFAVFSRITNHRFILTSGVGTGEYGETSTGVYANATWQQTCLTFDGTESTDATRMVVRVTDDGTACGGGDCTQTLTFTGSVPASTTAPLMGDFYFCAATSAVASWGSAASYIDEWAIWVPALTTAQVRDEVMTGDAEDFENLSTAPAPQRWYRFENDVTDEMGAQNGTASGSPTYTASVP